MNGMVSSFCLALTVLLYWGAKRLYRRHPLLLLSPVLLSPVLLIAILLALHIPYGTYIRDNQWLVNMLGPATVAFAIPIYKTASLIRRNAVALLAGILSGVALAIASSLLLGAWLRLDPQITLSLVPHSATTPFAMQASADIGGLPTLSAVFVILTGLIGSLCGPVMIRWLRIRSPLARGAGLGTSSHGFGSARALEIGKTEGSVALAAMVITGAVSVVAVPFAIKLIQGLRIIPVG